MSLNNLRFLPRSCRLCYDEFTPTGTLQFFCDDECKSLARYNNIPDEVRKRHVEIINNNKQKGSCPHGSFDGICIECERDVFLPGY